MTWDSENIIRIEFPKVLKTVQKFLRPRDKGFELVYMGAVPNSLPTILYQSKQCKLRIQSLRDRPHEEMELYFSYGRLHAPPEQDVIEWNKEKCYCWHSLEVDLVLPFLDGLSPADIDNKGFALPRMFREFSAANKEARWWSRAEFFSKRHAFIWKHYDQRFFDLFDLNHPDLWEEYCRFLREYYNHCDERDRQKNLPLYPYGLPKYMAC